MRLFIAINLPKEVKDYLWELKEEFRELGKFNLTAKSKYHITLKFLGEIKEDKLVEIKEKLSEIKFSSFETSINNKNKFIEKLETKVKPIKFKISSFELMKSILSKDGAKYETLETYSLN